MFSAQRLYFSGFFLFAVGCAPAEHGAASPAPPGTAPTAAVVPVASHVTLVRGYEGQKQYAEAAAGQDADRRIELFERFVTKPYQRCAQPSGTETQSLSESRLTTPVRDLETLKRTIAAIEAKALDRRVMRTAQQAATKLGADGISVCLFAYPPEDPGLWFVEGPGGGVNGFASRGDLWVEPFWLENGEPDDWLANVDYTTAHELHHAAWQRRSDGGSAPPSLLELMVSEGRADTFASQMVPGALRPWSQALSVTQEAQVWARMTESLDSTDPSVVWGYVFGSKDKGIPKYSGYTIGYRIVQSYLDHHPDSNVEAWTYMDAEDLLRESRYAPSGLGGR